MRPDARDPGFGLIEQIIAMTIVVGALLGLLSTLGATAKGVTTARQRTIAVSLAKQIIENLEGAAYTSVAMNTASLGGEPLVVGVAPNQTFEGEKIVPGGTTPYRSTPASVGTTFSLRTFVTAVPATGTGYRRITVLVDWPATTPRHSMRFSSLVFPLDYASYPASSGGAEATGGLVTVSGTLGGDVFDDVHLVLPGARVDTNASTLRTSIGAATGGTSYVGLANGPVAVSTGCDGAGTAAGECPRQTLDSIADNDSTSTTTTWVAGVGQPFSGGSVTTPGGTTITNPSGTMTSRASTDLCGTCGFGDSDGVPWADSAVATTNSATAGFSSSHGVGALTGKLWTLDGGWRATAAVDHDPTGGGLVSASSRVEAPALRLLQLSGAPVGFDGAVQVAAFTAGASVASGYTLAGPDVNTETTTRQIQLWDGAGYRSVTVSPGAAIDETAAATFTIGDHVISFLSHVTSQPSTFSTTGTAPRREAAAQHPSMLIVSVDVTITSATLIDPSLTTTTSTEPATTTTVLSTTTTTSVPSGTTIPSETTSVPSTTTTTTAPPVPLVTDRFSVVFDYGRVSAHDSWLAVAP